jgi:hypothetical protein
MRSQAQLSQTIQRFQDSFWEKKAADRPLVGVYDDRIFLPIGFLRRSFRGSIVEPQDLTEGLAMTEYEYWFRDRTVTCDDLLAFSAPWRAIPWLEACAGCPVRYADGSLAPGHFVESAEALADLPIPAGNGWFECLARQTARIENQLPPDCWVSPSILRGPSDILAAMRGITNFMMDLIDHPQAVRAAAGRVNRLLLDALDAHFARVKPKLGGYSHIFGYWAPEKTIAIQEDTMGMASPAAYRDIFMEHNAEVVRRLGAYVLFHLHATGYKHYRDVLNIPGLGGLQIVMETGGPTLRDMLPAFREILEKSRLILQVGDCVEHLPEVLRKLPREGLFLTISSRQIPSDQEFRQFISDHWKC